MVEFRESWEAVTLRAEFRPYWSQGNKVLSFNSIVLAAIRLFQHKEGWRGRTGGYVCYADVRGMPLMVHVMGSIGEEKAGKYCGFSQEKLSRLARHPEHWSSWQSRDPDRGEWGGGIRLGDGHMLGFSGLTEEGDEAVCLVAAIGFGALDEKQARNIANISCNTCFEPLLLLMQGRKV
jgi:hypothetical protein